MGKIQKSMILLKRRLGFDLALVGIGELDNRCCKTGAGSQGVDVLEHPVSLIRESLAAYMICLILAATMPPLLW